jgi:hypothetical protein
VRDVHVTLQDVHHPRCHENGQRLAGNVALPDPYQDFSDYGDPLTLWKQRLAKSQPAGSG